MSMTRDRIAQFQAGDAVIVAIKDRRRNGSTVTASFRDEPATVVKTTNKRIKVVFPGGFEYLADPFRVRHAG